VGSHAGAVVVAGAEVAGVEVAGAVVAGVEVAGAEVAGVEVAGVEVAGAEVAGVEVAGAEVAGVEVAGAVVEGPEVGGEVVEGAAVGGEREGSGLPPAKSPAINARYHVRLAPSSNHCEPSNPTVKKFQAVCGSEIAKFAINIPFHPEFTLLIILASFAFHSASTKEDWRMNGDIAVSGIM